MAWTKQGTLLGSIQSARKFVTLNATGTATAAATHVMTLAANATITLPSAPPDGTVCAFTRLDATAFTATIQRGGTDTILGTSPYLLKSGQFISFTYQAANTRWVPSGWQPSGSSGLIGVASAATALTVVSRDSAGRAQFVDPAVAQDVATKNYVDTAIGSRYYAEWSLSAQAMASGVGTTLSGLIVIRDTGNIGNTMNLSTGNWTCAQAGPYTLTMGIKYVTYVSSRFAMWIGRNGGATINRIAQTDITAPSATTEWSMSVTRWLDLGDVLTFNVDQFTGASQTVDASADISAISILYSPTS